MVKNDFTDMAKRIARLIPKIRRYVDMNIEGVMRQAANFARQNISANNSLVTFALRQSTKHHDALSADFNVTKTSRFSQQTYSKHVTRAGLPYAQFIEYGTGARQRGRPEPAGNFRAPSNPPVNAIHNWMLAKPVTARLDVDDGDDRFAAAQRIAARIARYGQRPHPFMRPAWHEVGGVNTFQLAHRNGVRRALRHL